MNSFLGSAETIARYIQYCRKHRIPLLPPHINESQARFSVGKDSSGHKGIRFGLAAILSVIVLGDESGYRSGEVQKVKLAAIEAGVATASMRCTSRPMPRQ